jgi:hypothetical protein
VRRVERRWRRRVARTTAREGARPARWRKRKRMEGIEAHRCGEEGSTAKLVRRTVVMARGCRRTGARRRSGRRWSWDAADVRRVSLELAGTRWRRSCRGRPEERSGDQRAADGARGDSWRRVSPELAGTRWRRSCRGRPEEQSGDQHAATELAGTRWRRSAIERSDTLIHCMCALLERE